MPSPLCREEERRSPKDISTPSDSPQQHSASAPLSRPTPAAVGFCLRRCRVRVLRRPAGLLARIEGSDLARRRTLRTSTLSLPETIHPGLEPGMTPQPSWERTVTRFAPPWSAAVTGCAHWGKRAFALPLRCLTAPGFPPPPSSPVSAGRRDSRRQYAPGYAGSP
jgi:hypothetical protein